MKNKLKCDKCKKEYDFYFHECKHAIQEYYGCKKCDDLCTRCNKEYANKIFSKSD